MITEETKIQNTDLDNSIKNILSKCNIFTISDLIKCDIARLKRIRGLGKKSITKIVVYTHKNGFFFNN